MLKEVLTVGGIVWKPVCNWYRIRKLIARVGTRVDAVKIDVARIGRNV